MPAPPTVSPEPSGEERREYFRIDTVLALAYRPTGERKLPQPRSTKLNLSGGGLRFDTEREFNQGDCLAVLLVVPGTSSIHTQAEIVYIQPPEDKHAVQSVAVRFTTISDKEREAIVRYVAKLQLERPNLPGQKK
jgi:c-di-GMP-binding flagellar brake protein YcgR